VTTMNRNDYLSLVREIEDFLYLEADVLDNREWERWLEFFTADVRYWMPIRKNLSFKERDRDFTDDSELAWFDNDKTLMEKRVKQILTGVHYAEDPLSRISHLVTNVRLPEPVDRVEDGQTVDVHARVLVYRNRLETEVDLLVARRQDTLRRVNGTFRIARRKVLLEQNVLMAKNLTFFF
jgi:3-phenylpropionate/cinnamic acid dioxygenase small subunit